MSQLTDRLNKMKEIADRASKRPFPYEDIRRMKADYADGYPDVDLSSLSADFNEHLMTILGLASGGIKRHLSASKQVVRLRRLLEQSFFDRYPQYGFLRDAGATKYPAFFADISITEELRPMLLETIRQADLKPSRWRPTLTASKEIALIGLGVTLVGAVLLGLLGPSSNGLELAAYVFIAGVVGTGVLVALHLVKSKHRPPLMGRRHYESEHRHKSSWFRR